MSKTKAITNEIVSNSQTRKILFRNLGSNISQLELTYLSNMNDVNKSLAMSRGFVDTNSNIFAVRSINHVAIR